MNSLKPTNCRGVHSEACLLLAQEWGTPPSDCSSAMTWPFPFLPVPTAQPWILPPNLPVWFLHPRLCLWKASHPLTASGLPGGLPTMTNHYGAGTPSGDSFLTKCLKRPSHKCQHKCLLPQDCPVGVAQGTKKLQYIYTMEDYAAVTKKELTLCNSMGVSGDYSNPLILWISI